MESITINGKKPSIMTTEEKRQAIQDYASRLQGRDLDHLLLIARAYETRQQRRAEA